MKSIAPDYNQVFLFPPSLEDLVPPDHPARFLREFVDELDLGSLNIKQKEALTGRPPFAASLLLKVWLYGYFFRVRSVRKLETGCREIVPLMWLSGMHAPDHNTLWRFWGDNKVALRSVFKQTVKLAIRTDCVGFAVLAVDGTKIISAGNRRGWTKEYMEKLERALDESLDQIELKVLAEGEELKAEPPRLPSGMAQRRQLRDQIRAGLEQLREDGREHYQPTDPQARTMKVQDGFEYAYNAQAIADSRCGIITGCEVTRQETDKGALVPMIEQAKENLGAAAANALCLADAGYGAGQDLQLAAERGHAVLAPPMEGKPAGDNPYASQHFEHDPIAGTVTCPRGEELTHEGHTTRKGLRVERYRCRCKACPVREACSKDKKGRQIEIWPHSPHSRAMREALEDPARRKIWRQRSWIIEPCFAHIKEHDGVRRWSYRDHESVRSQWSMLCAASNLRIIYRRRYAKGSKSSFGILKRTRAAHLAVFGPQKSRVSSHWKPRNHLRRAKSLRGPRISQNRRNLSLLMARSEF